MLIKTSVTNFIASLLSENYILCGSIYLTFIFNLNRSPNTFFPRHFYAYKEDVTTLRKFYQNLHSRSVKFFFLMVFISRD